MKLSDIILGKIYSNVVNVVALFVCLRMVSRSFFPRDYSNNELLIMEIIVPVAWILVCAVSLVLMRKYIKQGEEPCDNVDRNLYAGLAFSILSAVLGVLDYTGVI